MGKGNVLEQGVCKSSSGNTSAFLREKTKKRKKQKNPKNHGGTLSPELIVKACVCRLVIKKNEVEIKQFCKYNKYNKNIIFYHCRSCLPVRLHALFDVPFTPVFHLFCLATNLPLFTTVNTC